MSVVNDHMAMETLESPIAKYDMIQDLKKKECSKIERQYVRSGETTRHVRISTAQMDKPATNLTIEGRNAAVKIGILKNNNSTRITDRLAAMNRTARL